MLTVEAVCKASEAMQEAITLAARLRHHGDFEDAAAILEAGLNFALYMLCIPTNPKRRTVFQQGRLNELSENWHRASQKGYALLGHPKGPRGFPSQSGE